nr:MAG TPA: hypothetical protein [Caudoviricetes sp.]
MVIKIIYVDLRHEIATTGRFPGNAKYIKQ